MPDLALNYSQYLELEKLAIGALAPLTGFMNDEAFNSVVDDMRLPKGGVFPLPVLLDVTADEAKRLSGSPSVALSYDGSEVGVLKLESVFTCDKDEICAKVYGTQSLSHPGVHFFHAGGKWFLGGDVEMTRRVETNLSQFEPTPEEVKRIIAKRGWKTIAGFQTRNVPHRAHEYLQRVALEYVDGLFIHPLVGKKKRGDYTPVAVIEGYRALIDGFYPPDRILFGVLTTSMRYAGPREAVFHAIVRRNYGCTHFVVGRDHAGVGDFYGMYDAHALTERFDGELGIEILRLRGPYHCNVCDSIVTDKTCQHEITQPEAITHISGTDMRAMLLGGQEPDTSLMRPQVIEALRGVQLFIEEEGE